VPHHRASSGHDRAPLRAGDRHGGGPAARRGHVCRGRRRRARAGGLHGPPAVERVTASPPLLTVDGVVAGYTAADEILKGVSVSLAARELVRVIGPNGAGKSTLLKVIAGLLRPGRGSVRLGDRAIHGRPAREICALGVAFVPQEQNVFPTMTVRENLEIGGFIDPRS